MKTADDILGLAEGLSKTLAVTAAEDIEILLAVKQARERKIAAPILIGNSRKIRELAKTIGLELHNGELRDAGTVEESVRTGIRLIREKEAQILMKGLVNTRDFFQVVLDKQHGLNITGLLSHVALFFPEFYPKPILVTDAGLNLCPGYEEKLVILRHGIEVLQKLDVPRPRIAILAHNEVPSDKVPASTDAIRLVAAAHAGELPECIIEGPLALDLALNKSACRQKKFKTRVGGRADLLLCPDIVSGNILYKSMTVIGNATGASFIAGGSVPIIVTSRGDTVQTKLLSIGFAAAAS